MAIDVFNEKETGYVALTFTDEEGAAVTPDSATYTLYDEASKNTINSRDQIVISGLASSIDLELEPDDNVIVNNTKTYEIHILLVEWIYNTDKKGKDEYRFSVKNLVKVT